jgi:hypothetical protein
VLITARNLRQLVMLPLLAQFHSAKAVCLHNGVNSPASTRHNGRMTSQCKFVYVLVFFYTYNIIYEQLINILLILFNFRFTNIEAARTITLAFKSSMEIPLFQWSQVSRHPEWRPNIDAWFQRFQVGVNF